MADAVPRTEELSEAHKLQGALILSPCLEKVLLTRYASNRNVWTIPHGRIPSASTGSTGLVALVQEHVGLDISTRMSNFHVVKADLSPRDAITVYIATRVPADSALSPARGTVAVAQWHSLRELMSNVASAASFLNHQRGPMHTSLQIAGGAPVVTNGPAVAVNVGGGTAASPAAAAASGGDGGSSYVEWQWLAPLLPHLVDFFLRHPNLRLPDEVPPSVTELAGLLVYRKATWKGTLPRDHLLDCCHSRQLPEPCYNLVVRKAAGGGGPRFMTATCTLSHLGLQVTPEYPSPTEEEAEQSAALAAIVWLEGGLTVYSHHVRVVPVGFPALCRPEGMRAVLEVLEAKRKQLWALQNKDLLLQQMDQRRHSLAEEMVGLERAQAALREGRLADSGRDVVDVLGAFTRHHLDDDPLRIAAAIPVPKTPRPAKRARTAQVPGSATDAQDPASVPPGSTTSEGTTRAAGPGGGSGGGQPKTTMQELKEVYERRNLGQPNFQYSQENGGHFCSLLIPGEGNNPAVRVTSDNEPNKKRAKEAVTLKALQHLGASPA